jgi:hypothetical protein
VKNFKGTYTTTKEPNALNPTLKTYQIFTMQSFLRKEKFKKHEQERHAFRRLEVTMV